MTWHAAVWDQQWRAIELRQMFSYEVFPEATSRRVQLRTQRRDSVASNGQYRWIWQLLSYTFRTSSYPGYHVKWQSRTIRRRDHLEIIQHISPRFLAYKSGHSTNVRDASIVAKYKFCLLPTRRLADEAIFLFKILNRFIDCPQLLSFINLHKASWVSLFHSAALSSRFGYINAMIPYRQVR